MEHHSSAITSVTRSRPEQAAPIVYEQPRTRVLARVCLYRDPPRHPCAFMVQCRWAFRNGEACWEGPARSALVELRCGETTKLVAVDEDGKCTYWFLLITPYACEIPFDAAERRAIEADIMQAQAQPDEHSGEQAAQSSPDEAMASTRTPRMDAGEMPQRRKTAPARKKRKKRPADSAKQHES